MDESDFSELSYSNPLFRKMKSLEYSVYLILQIINKVVLEHRYPFRQTVMNINMIPIVAKLVDCKSGLINIEIVKFYKAILKSKDAVYIQYIVSKDMFYPIFSLFKHSYKPRNPAMIFSCIRDLYDLILTSKQSNDFYSPKLAEYLMHTCEESKTMMADPLYVKIFSKYDKNVMKEGDQDDFFNKDPSP